MQKFYPGVIFQTKHPKKSIFDHLQLTADNKKGIQAGSYAIEQMKAAEICYKNLKKIGGGVGVGSGSNFALKF